MSTPPLFRAVLSLPGDRAASVAPDPTKQFLGPRPPTAEEQFFMEISIDADNPALATGPNRTIEDEER